MDPKRDSAVVSLIMLFYLLRGGLTIEALAATAIFLGALTLAISVHEFAHALTSQKLGDPTAKLMGRLTLNPRAHLDPVGTLMLILIGFGWGKPVPYNPLNLDNPKVDSALISLSGPLSNILTAFVLALPLRLHLPIFSQGVSFELILTVVSLNIGLAVFNLIPIYPLDGFRVVGGLLPSELSRIWEGLAAYGTFLILFLVLLPSGFSLIGTFVVPVSRSLLSLILGFPAGSFF